jgi:hypothetical protein
LYYGRKKPRGGGRERENHVDPESSRSGGIERAPTILHRPHHDHVATAPNGRTPLLGIVAIFGLDAAVTREQGKEAGHRRTRQNGESAGTDGEVRGAPWCPPSVRAAGSSTRVQGVRPTDTCLRPCSSSEELQRLPPSFPSREGEREAPLARRLRAGGPPLSSRTRRSVAGAASSHAPWTARAGGGASSSSAPEKDRVHPLQRRCARPPSSPSQSSPPSSRRRGPSSRATLPGAACVVRARRHRWRRPRRRGEGDARGRPCCASPSSPAEGE